MTAATWRRETPCTLAGQHLLGDVVETLPTGRQRRACKTPSCHRIFVVEPDATAVYADCLPEETR